MDARKQSMPEDADLWRSRWAEGRIGFHEGVPNASLSAHVGHLRESTAPGARTVLAPLAGKSVDLAFLAGQGFDVTGVELVRDAAVAFFRENGLSPSEGRWHGFETLASPPIRFAIGDFFGLELPASERFDCAYDRAALIAVNPSVRERYVATLTGALKPGAPLLLVTLALIDGAPVGPPYSVTAEDVARLFAGHRIALLEERDLTASEARFKERGASRVLEQAWLITT